MKKSSTIKLVASVAMLGLATGVFAFRKEAQRDKLSEASAALAGKGAADCGRALLPDTGDYDEYNFILSTDKCAVENFKKRKPFFARYATAPNFPFETKSSPTKYEAVVGTAQGKIYVLSTSHPEDKSSIQRRLIANPRIVRTYNREYLKCR